MSFSDPSHNVEQFDLQSGMTVADFGTGSGYYAFAAAKAVGDKGKVYAIDVQKPLLEKLKREAVSR
ncbi:MAG: methyltransferase domain-containing protein, partial [Candidatus Taylorbacteria bacterium]|nr:methyltransferase domain-containing protein [Candidatus Taylorbacteria bacterium]